MRCARWPTCLKMAGISVRYAIHPVVGWMPGHILLAKTNVPYDEVFGPRPQRVGSLNLLDCGEQPVAALPADESPHLLGLDRGAGIAADDIVGVARRPPRADDAVVGAPLQIGGGILQVALLPAFAQIAFEQ